MPAFSPISFGRNVAGRDAEPLSPMLEGFGKFELAALSGDGTYTFYAGGGNVRLNHGPTPALGSSTSFGDCSAGCAVTMPKGLRYVQIERESGALGEIRPVLVRV